MLRKAQERTVEDVWRSIGSLLPDFKLQECAPKSIRHVIQSRRSLRSLITVLKHGLVQRCCEFNWRLRFQVCSRVLG
jgi:hypothetical protein